MSNPGFKPICIAPDDQLTRNTAKQILSHNEFGRLQKYWKDCNDA